MMAHKDEDADNDNDNIVVQGQQRHCHHCHCCHVVVSLLLCRCQACKDERARAQVLNLVGVQVSERSGQLLQLTTWGNTLLRVRVRVQC